MINDLTDVPDFSDRLAVVKPRATAKARLSIVGRSAGVWAFSISVHVVVAVVGYRIIRHWSLFSSAESLATRGDGAAASEQIDHAGAADASPGAEGSGSLKIGWSPPDLPEAPLQEAAAMQSDATLDEITTVKPPELVLVDESDDAQATTPASSLLDLGGIPFPKPSQQRPALVDPPPPVERLSGAEPQASAAPVTVRHDFTPLKEAADTGSNRSIEEFSHLQANETTGGLQRSDQRRGSNGAGGRTTALGGQGISGQPGFPAEVQGAARFPKYPYASRQRQEAGKVVLQVEVLTDGSVGAVRVLSDAGFPRLARAAEDAARCDHFVPARLDGKPVVSLLTGRTSLNCGEIKEARHGRREQALRAYPRRGCKVTIAHCSIGTGHS